MSIYTRKPTKEEYSRVAQAVLRKYPFLRNSVNPEGSIITKLRTRFRYTGDPADRPKVVRKLEDPLPAKKLKVEKDGKYMVPEGEDSTSFVRYNMSLTPKALHCGRINENVF